MEQALSVSCNELVGLMEKLANHDKDVALTDLKLKAFEVRMSPHRFNLVAFKPCLCFIIT